MKYVAQQKQNKIRHVEIRTKHVKIDNGILEKLDNGTLELRHVNSIGQIAVCLTKGLEVKELHMSCNKMGMIDIYCPS
jgi:hypothetical protein